jgi:hypothetical protein
MSASREPIQILSDAEALGDRSSQGGSQESDSQKVQGCGSVRCLQMRGFDGKVEDCQKMEYISDKGKGA